MPISESNAGFCYQLLWDLSCNRFCYQLNFHFMKTLAGSFKQHQTCVNVTYLVPLPVKKVTVVDDGDVPLMS